MNQNCLNYLMLLYVHSELTDKIDLAEAANIIIENKDSWKNGFGTVSDKNRTNNKKPLNFNEEL